MDIRKPNVSAEYLRHKDINNYLDYLSRRYRKTVTVFNIGKSYEGRELKAIKIDLNKGNKKIQKKQWVFIEAGTHAREWITISTALYCIYQLTEKYFRNIDVLKDIGFVIVPLVNPDGYEYTHETNSSWRKNRRPVPNCKYVGTDCNRNYDFHWKGGITRLGKNTFQGVCPFSEPETQAIQNVFKRFNPNILFFLSLHSYATSLMYPWAYSKEPPPPTSNLHQLAECGQKAIQQATGRKYRCGSISKLTRKTVHGSVADYAYGVEKIPFVLVMELPSSKYGFQPPKNKIESIVTESWIGIKAMCQEVIKSHLTVK